METCRIPFKCKVAVSIKGKLYVIDRKLVYQSQDTLHHLDAFDETVAAYGDDWSIEYPAGYYECDGDLIYETILLSGGQDGTEYDSDIEFEDLRLIAL